MRIAIVRSKRDAAVICRRGRQNQEFYRDQDIDAVASALAEGGHEVRIADGDMSLVGSLAELGNKRNQGDELDFMVFNLAYGVQGANRYSQVPGMLELLGIPYVGSGPRAHTLSLDKYVAKLMVREAGVPTPDFQLLRAPDDALTGGLDFPLIVKPQFEAASFGVKVVRTRAELEQAATAILEEFQQPTLVEAFVPGREVNCGLVGNDPPRALPVLEIVFANPSAEAIFDHDTKETRTWSHVCPAPIPEALAGRVQELAQRAFGVLGCRDAARADFRINESGEPYFLEINSMVAIHPSASFFRAAQAVPWTFAELIAQVLDAAIARVGGRQASHE